MESSARKLLNTILDKSDELLSEVHLPIGEYLGESQASTGRTTPEMVALFMIIRSLGWCHAAKLLISQGYCEEAIALIRGAFERLILSYEWASTDSPTSSKKMLEAKPQKLVNKFKIFFPAAGEFYGKISEITHYSPELFKRSFSFHDGLETRVNFTYTPESKPIESISTALLLYSQIDLSSSLSDWIIARTKVKTTHWIRSNSNDLQLAGCQHQLQLDEWTAEIKRIASAREDNSI
jgi:hypothetical protein